MSKQKEDEANSVLSATNGSSSSAVVNASSSQPVTTIHNQNLTYFHILRPDEIIDQHPESQHTDFERQALLEENQRLREENQRLREADKKLIIDYKRDNLLRLLSADLVPSFDSRILVVGAYEAGKTTLVLNLIGKRIPKERRSTDGIDVYFGNLLFDLKTQKLLKKTKGVHSFPKAIYEKILSYLNSDEVDDEQQTGASSGKTKPYIPDDDVFKQISKRIDEYAIDVPVERLAVGEIIPIPVLDFAGQIVYHATHQTFITSHGIYLITFNGSKNLDDPLSDQAGDRKTTILGMSKTGIK